jgi:hypothetical protein
MYYSLVLASRFFFGKYFVKLNRVYFEKCVTFSLGKKWDATLNNLIDKDSVITFRISSTSSAEGVEGVSSSILAAFGSGAAVFLFFEAATFGSGLDFLFFRASSSSFTIVAAYLLRTLTIVFLFLPFGTLV